MPAGAKFQGQKPRAPLYNDKCLQVIHSELMRGPKSNPMAPYSGYSIMYPQQPFKEFESQLGSKL